VKKVVAPPDKAVVVEGSEPRVIARPLWEVAQTRIDATARKASEGGNPSAARRTGFLLSGLLVCGCCDRPDMFQTGGKCDCRNRKQCGNPTPVSNARIKARVFAPPRHLFLAPDLAARFDKALAEERRRLDGDGGKAVVKSLARRKATAERGSKRSSAKSNRAVGALFTRAQDLEAVIEGRARQIAAHHAAQTQAAPVPLGSA
jgi:site-specific DNA recombinase